MPKIPTLDHTAARTARAALAADALAGHDAPALLRRAMSAIDRAVPFDAGGFSPTDPDTLLWTGGVVKGFTPDVVPLFFESELLGGDVLTFREMLRRGNTVGTLTQATRGEVERSDRFRRMYEPNGMRSEVRVAFTADGRCYGTGCLLRDTAAPDFTARETAFLAEAARHVGAGLRSALCRAQAEEAPGTLAPGVIVVDDDVRPLSVTDQAAAWIDELAGVGPDTGDALPAVIFSVVGRAKRNAAGGEPAAPRARVRTAAGRWVSVHASALSGDMRAWAVVLEPARPTEMLPLIAAGHDLTPREQEVLALLLRGMPDKVIAQELWLSAHTAREHARRVLQKFGVRSRGELQALLFEEHYEPWSEVA